MDPVPKRPKSIVLYVDGSKHWHALARMLGELARSAEARVTVVSSLLLSSSRQRAMETAKELLAVPESRVKLDGRPGLIEFTLPDAARDAKADLVAVGHLGSADRLTSGLIAQLVAKRTPTSVLIARGRPERIRKILACTEGKEQGHHNHARALDLARTFGARLDVLHVVSQMGLTDTGQREIEEDLRDFLHSDAPEAAHLVEAQTRARAVGVEGEILVRRGLVVEEILAAIEEGGHDLLVIGAHDLAGPGSHLYEDFASLIVRASPISTLMVRRVP